MALDKLVDSTQLDADLTTVANAIRTKGGTSATLVFPSGMVSAINAIPSGGAKMEPVDEGVNFIDYDGTVLYTWLPSEVSDKTSLPNNPSHTGLVAQGWNWTLAEIKSYFTVCPDAVIIVGQVYATSDGRTRIYIDLQEGRLTPYLRLGINGSVDVDWGDGTAHSTMTGSDTSVAVYASHTYSVAGDYVISLGVTGAVVLFNESTLVKPLISGGKDTQNENKVYAYSVKKIEIGSNIGASTYAFYGLNAMRTITSPVRLDGGFAFSGCSALKALVVPRDSDGTPPSNYMRSCSAMRFISFGGNIRGYSTSCLSGCSALEFCTLPYNNLSYTTISGSLLSSCTSLKRLAIPSNYTEVITSGLSGCQTLAGIVFPATMTDIGATALQNCYGLGFIEFKSVNPPTVANANAFTGLPTDCEIRVPAAALNAYKTATNYPNPTTYNYVGV